MSNRENRRDWEEAWSTLTGMYSELASLLMVYLVARAEVDVLVGAAWRWW